MMRIKPPAPALAYWSRNPQSRCTLLDGQVASKEREKQRNKVRTQDENSQYPRIMRGGARSRWHHALGKGPVAHLFSTDVEV